MDVNLKDLGATLVTGAYFLLGVAFLVCAIFGWDFFFFLRQAKRLSSAGVTLLMLCLAFGSGMLLEDISNKFVDTGAAKIPFLDVPLLPLDEDLRAETLYGKEFMAALPSGKHPGPTAHTDELKIGRLSRRAAELKLLESQGQEGIAAQQAVLNKDPNLDRKKACDAASRLYYDAKNTVYTVDNYYDELKQIQTRIDFSRSFALLSLTLSAIVLALTGIALGWPSLGSRIGRRFYQPPPPVLGRRGVIKRAVGLVLILVMIFLLGRFAYISEEVEFDKRAYGYFFSLSARKASTVPDAGPAAPLREAPPKTNAEAGLPAAIGYSGMVSIDQSTFLVVHDVKAGTEAPRLGTLRVNPQSTPLYAPIQVAWGEDPPNDFEAVCAVPGKEREVLVAESSYKAGKFGRIFHLVLNEGLKQWNVTVLGKISLPEDTENIEGLACIAKKDGTLLLLLGERGGSEKDPPGRVRWATLDLATHRLQVVGEKKLMAPPMSPAQKDVRACADLYLDGRHRIWTVATQDRSDDGPFRSVVYQAGTIDPDSADPVQMFSGPTASWTLDGVKVEALSASPYDQGSLSVATDDENYEGIWRPLFPASGDNAAPK